MYNKVSSVAAMLLLALAVSCTKVDIADGPGSGISSMSAIDFSLTWDETLFKDGIHPDNITVIMSRIQNETKHYVYTIDAQGNLVDPTPVLPPSDDQPSEDEGTEEDGTTDGSEGTEDGNTGADGENTGNEGTGTEDGTIEEGNAEEGNAEGDSNTEEDGSTDGENAGSEDTGNGDTTTDEGTEDGTTEDGITGDSNTETDPEPVAPNIVHNGLYSVMAVAAHSPDHYYIPDQKEFCDSIAYRMRDLYIAIPQMSEEEKAEELLVDYNPLYPNIRSVDPLYYVRAESKSQTKIGSGNSTVILSPQQLTRKITFTLTLDIEEGVTIDRLVGMISGVPVKAQFISGIVTDVNTGKMHFDLAETGERQEVSTTDKGTPVHRLTFKGSVNVLGLFPPQEATAKTGPGIITLLVHASAVNDNGTKYTRIYHDNTNLKTQIEAAEIMLETEDRTGYEFSDRGQAKIREFSIEARPFTESGFVVTRDNIIYSTGQGSEHWVGNDTSDDDGLNHEF